MALALYREALRVCRAFPIAHLRPKLCQNARTLMELHKRAEPERAAELVREGRQQVAALRRLGDLEPAILDKLFDTSFGGPQ